MEKGPLSESPITGIRMTITDGAYHAVDSSDMAFQQAALGAFRQGFQKAKPVLMEPIMKVVVEGPTEFQGAIMGSINQRRGIIIGTTEESNYTVVESEVPLSEMFGYSTVLRSLQGGIHYGIQDLPPGAAQRCRRNSCCQEKGKREKVTQEQRSATDCILLIRKGANHGE